MMDGGGAGSQGNWATPREDNFFCQTWILRSISTVYSAQKNQEGKLYKVRSIQEQKSMQAFRIAID